MFTGNFRIFRRLRTGCFLALLFSVMNVQSLDAQAQDARHGLSAFGDLQLNADFKQFNYVNPMAPKQGRLSMIGTAGLITFNSLNGYILRGDPAQGLTYLFDSLMVRNWDEPDAVYGLVAKSAELSKDKRSVTFFLRSEA